MRAREETRRSTSQTRAIGQRLTLEITCPSSTSPPEREAERQGCSAADVFFDGSERPPQRHDKRAGWASNSDRGRRPRFIPNRFLNATSERA